MESLGKRIAALRRKKDLKQDDVSQALNVTPQAVSKWENDQTCPDISLLPQLAQILGVTVDELLSGKQEVAPVVTLMPEENRKALKDLILRVVVDSKDGDKVRINLPMLLVQAALQIGMEIPQVNGSPVLKSIDLEQVLLLVQQGATGCLVEAETADGNTVRIFVE